MKKGEKGDGSIFHWVKKGTVLFFIKF